MRNKLDVLTIALIVLFMTTLPLGCVPDGQDLAALLEKTNKNHDKIADQQKKIDDLLIKVRFNPDEPKKPEDLYQSHLEIGFRLQKQQAINDKIMKNYRKAKSVTDDKKESEYLEKGLEAYDLKAKNIEAGRKIQGVYIRIWQSIVENKKTLGKSEYKSLEKGLTKNVGIQENTEKQFLKLKKEADEGIPQ